MIILQKPMNLSLIGADESRSFLIPNARFQLSYPILASGMAAKVEYG